MKELPSGWTPSTLGELANVIRGVTYKKEQAKSSPACGLLPLLRATNISQELDFDKLVYVPDRNVSELQLLQQGDIVIAASSGSKSVVGKAAILRSDWNGTFGAFCAVVRPNRGIVAKYLSYYMQTREYRSYISACSAGVNINNLKAADLAAFDLLLAPRPEQDRIVDEIEKQFTRLDAATAALKRVQANLKRYRASVLKAACEGRLVPTEAELARNEGRDYEPADQLLQRILRERRARWEADALAKMQASGKPPKDDHWKQKYKGPSAPDTKNLPDLPEGWHWASLDQLAVSVRNGISVKPILEEGLAILRISAVRAMSVNLDDVRFLPDNSEFRQYALTEDDLLFVRYNGNPDISGRCGRVGKINNTAVHPDKLIRVDLCFKSALSAWVEIVTNFGASRRHLELKTRTTAGQSGVSGEDIKAIPIPLCPLEEAARIAAESSRLLSAQEALHREADRGAMRSSSLRCSILKRAFTGQLVPQDPTDEPASVLLDRIRAERLESSKNDASLKTTQKRGQQ